MADGHFESACFAPRHPCRRRETSRLYNGNLTASSGVTRLVCDEISAEPTTDSPVTIELDGESVDSFRTVSGLNAAPGRSGGLVDLVNIVFFEYLAFVNMSYSKTIRYEK